MINSEQPATLTGWLNYLEQLHPTEIDLGLDRINRVLASLSWQPFQCPVITVSGTNGKGSVVALLSAVYQAAGYQVGCYTSPHLFHYNERICINDQPISDDALIDYFQCIEAARKDVSLTYFEFGTIAALLHFKAQSVDLVILEVGLGGRLDAVNCIDADLAIISSIDLDHMNYLGTTREEIAIEKAGIFRSAKPAICGDPEPPTKLIDYAQSMNVPLYIRGRDFHEQQEGDYWHWQMEKPIFDQQRNLNMPQLSVDNATTALMAIQLLQKQLSVNRQAIQTGIKNAKLFARQQRVIIDEIDYWFDVGHNPQALAYLTKRLQAEYHCNANTKQTNIHLVVGMMADKDIFSSLKALLPIVTYWYLVSLPAPRGATSAMLHNVLSKLGVSQNIVECNSAQEGYNLAIAHVQRGEVLVVCGSFATVGPILEKWEAHNS